MGINPTQDDRTGRDKDPLARRSLLRKAAAGLLGGAVAVFGLARPASATDASKTQSPSSPQRAWQAYCCQLLYGLCSTSQRNNCSNRWTWSCCAYVGSSLTRVTCGECYTYSCSWYSFGSAC